MIWAWIIIIGAVLALLCVTFKKNIFAFLISVTCAKANKMMGPYKSSLFKDLNEDAKKAGPHKFKILEIGGGSGTNYEFVTTPVDWTVTEPNLCFQSYFKKNVQKNGGKHRINDLIEARGEDLGKFESGSFDAVVISLVLCSVPREGLQSTLDEIRRVLKPGGSFYFIEHVGAPRGTWLRKAQDLFSESGFWPAIADGCEINRDTEETVRASGFSGCKITNYRADTIMMYFFSTQLYGKATK